MLTSWDLAEEYDLHDIDGTGRTGDVTLSSTLNRLPDRRHGLSSKGCSRAGQRLDRVARRRHRLAGCSPPTSPVRLLPRLSRRPVDRYGPRPVVAVAPTTTRRTP